MTSSGTSTDGPPPPRGIPVKVVVLTLGGALLLAGWIYILWHHNFHITAAAVVLGLGWTAVLGTLYFLWRTADNADLDDHEDWWRPTGKLDELQREKRALLKAIKETELDRDTGKLSNDDADEIIGRYRARAIEVIKAIEAGEAPPADDAGGDLRARIEREVRARVEVDKEKDRKKGKAPARRKDNDEEGRA